MTISRRQFIQGSAASALIFATGAEAATNRDAYFSGTVEDYGLTFRGTNWKKIQKKGRRQFVDYDSVEPPGTVVVDTSHHHLYVIFENKTALRYGVGVGRDGFRWYGRARVDRKAIWPRWTPPPEMRVRQPELPEYMEGGPKNPLGPRALYLFRSGRDLGYRLHGTTEPWSIGSNVSSGCIRMFSEDVIDLYQRCPQGTRVLVLRHLGAPPENEEAGSNLEPAQ
jgi:lipoprotein-anchoring transpeptidase ErfK/SrfK